MKIKNILLILFALLIGIAIGIYIGKKVLKKTIVMRFNPLGSMTVGAAAGEKLEWRAFDQKTPVAVTFKHGFQPCTDPADPAKGACTLKDSGLYTFNCTGCKDPGVGGGDDTVIGSTGIKSIGAAGPPADPDTVDVYCDPATSTAKADAVQGKQGSTFALQGEGSLPNFTAKFITPGTCNEGDSLSGTASSSPTCTIKPVVTADTSYSYTIKITGCADGMGYLTELGP
ncbi:MAG TPA: hypothetical protein VFC21_04675 [Bryobacteraceae bacterium]|nr:hypothetical protein [Bryobacteraceae bacterium]